MLDDRPSVTATRAGRIWSEPMANVKKVTEELDHEPVNSSPLRDEDRLSLGTTMLNVAVSRGRWTDGGICKGRCVWYVGESESGKAQPIDSGVLTPNGWCRMGEIEV